MLEPTMALQLNVAWWNANDLYHFDADKIKARNSRWPRSRRIYEEKCRRVDLALRSFFDKFSTPQLLGLGETTQQAAIDLRDRLLPDYRILSLDVQTSKPTLQVAILYSPDAKGSLEFRESPPIAVPGTPRGTRPMAVLDALTPTSELRCIACHWQARLDEASEITRFRIADYLAQYTHDYLTQKSSKARGVLVMGDLNEEPYGRNLEILNAHRHRERSLGLAHWADNDVKRTHLYNPSWRLMGEKYAHPEPTLRPRELVGSAGTYYWEAKRSWAHLDHFIVSGSLLGNQAPYFDENESAIVSLVEFLTNGLPIKFSEDSGKFRGVSDHLPIYGRIFL